jgi:ABC-type sugar transport system permease subunit
MQTLSSSAGPSASLRADATALRSARRRRIVGDALMGYAFVAPAVLLFIVFQGYPIVRGLMIAFSDYRFLVPDHQPFNGLANWYEMWRDATFWAALNRSFQYTGMYVVGLVLLGLLGAVLIGSFQSQKEASVYRVIAYLPVVLPIAVALLLWRQLLNNQFGYVNHLLRDVLGLPAPNWLGDATWVIPTLVIAAVWKQVGQTILLFLIGIYGINREMYEAAAIDGASALRKFIHITLPLLRPSFVLVLVLSAGVLGTAEESLIFFPNENGPRAAAQIVGRYSYDVAFKLGDMRWGYAAAMSLTVGLISMLASAIVFRVLRGERPE